MEAGVEVVTMGAKRDRTVELRRFRRYPAYKDSGIEWLGEIPAHWDVKRLSRTVTTVPFLLQRVNHQMELNPKGSSWMT